MFPQSSPPLNVTGEIKKQADNSNFTETFILEKLATKQFYVKHNIFREIKTQIKPSVKMILEAYTQVFDDFTTNNVNTSQLNQVPSTQTQSNHKQRVPSSSQVVASGSATTTAETAISGPASSNPTSQRTSQPSGNKSKHPSKNSETNVKPQHQPVDTSNFETLKPNQIVPPNKGWQVCEPTSFENTIDNIANASNLTMDLTHDAQAFHQNHLENPEIQAAEPPVSGITNGHSLSEQQTINQISEPSQIHQSETSPENVTGSIARQVSQAHSSNKTEEEVKKANQVLESVTEQLKDQNLIEENETPRNSLDNNSNNKNRTYNNSVSNNTNKPVRSSNHSISSNTTQKNQPVNNSNSQIAKGSSNNSANPEVLKMPRKNNLSQSSTNGTASPTVSVAGSIAQSNTSSSASKPVTGNSWAKKLQIPSESKPNNFNKPMPGVKKVSAPTKYKFLGAENWRRFYGNSLKK